MNKSPKCSSCGLLLQTDNHQKAGFIPENKFELTKPICQNCYRIIHYKDNELVSRNGSVPSMNFLDKINYNDNVFFLTDIFHFFISVKDKTFQYFLKGNIPLTLVITKLDILDSKNVNLKHLKQKISSFLFEKYHLKIPVIFISANKKYNLEQILNTKIAKKNYFLGLSNNGKSTLLNKLLQEEILIETEMLNSTKELMSFKLGNNFFLDTPGISNNTSIYNFISFKDTKYLTYNRAIKPTIFQMFPRNAIYVGGMIKLNYIAGKKANFIFYTSNKLKKERIRMRKDDFRYWSEFSKKPHAYPQTNTSWECQTFKWDDQKVNITFFVAGLALIKIKGAVSEISIYLPKNLSIGVIDNFI